MGTAHSCVARQVEDSDFEPDDMEDSSAKKRRRKFRIRPSSRSNAATASVSVSPGTAGATTDNFSTPTLHHLRKGKYKKFAISGTDIPLVKVTTATPMHQLRGSVRAHLNSINTVEGKEVDIPKINLGVFILNKLKEHPQQNSRIFGILDGRSLSRKELIEQTLTTENLLRRLQLSPGVPVLCMVSNCMQFPALAIACHLRRIPICLINPKHCERKEMLKEFETLGIQAIFCTKQTSEKAEKLKISVSKVAMDCETPPRPGMLTLSQIQNSTESLNQPHAQSYSQYSISDEAEDGSDEWNEIAVIAWTMGRSSAPKQIGISHFNMVASIVQIQNVGFFGNDEKVMGVLPLYHPFGLSVQLYNCIVAGFPLILLPAIDLKAMLQCIQTYQISMILGVPSLLEFLAYDGSVSDFDLGSLTSIFTVFTPVDPLIVEQLYRRFPDILLYNGYGLCEATSITHVSAGSRLFSTSVGKVLPNIVCKIQDEERDIALGAKKKGEICIRGPQIVHGVQANSSLQTYMDSDGWLRTGDIGMYDGENNFFICGLVERKKRKTENFLGSAIRKVDSIQNLGLTPLLSRKKQSTPGGTRRSLVPELSDTLTRKTRSTGDLSDGSDNVFLD